MGGYFRNVKQSFILRVKGGTDTLDNEKSAMKGVKIAANAQRATQDKIPTNRPKTVDAKATSPEKSKFVTSTQAQSHGGESTDPIDSRQKPASPSSPARPHPAEPARALSPPPAVDAADPAASPPQPLISEAYGFYALLGVERDCEPAEIRCAYRRLALAAHPDRNPDDPTAKARFQALQWVYETLRDADRRRLYDESGGSAAAAEGDGPIAGAGGLEALLAHFRGLFRRAGGVEGVARFEAEYRGSAMEAADVEEVLCFYDITI